MSAPALSRRKGATVATLAAPRGAPVTAELRGCISRVLLTKRGSTQRRVILAAIDTHLVCLAAIERSYAIVVAETEEQLLLDDAPAGRA